MLNLQNLRSVSAEQTFRKRGYMFLLIEFLHNFVEFIGIIFFVFQEDQDVNEV